MYPPLIGQTVSRDLNIFTKKRKKKTEGNKNVIEYIELPRHAYNTTYKSKYRYITCTMGTPSYSSYALAYSSLST